MPRLMQSTVILAKVETTNGTDAAPGNTTDAVLVRSFDIAIDQQFASRPQIRGFFGADDQYPSVRRGKIKLIVDLQASGVATTAPQWGSLLLGCANAQALLSTPSRVEYTPVSTARKSLTIWGYKDGLLYKFVSCMGDAVFNLAVGEIPTIEFNYTGLISVAPAAGANPVPTLTAWIAPVAASPVNTTKVIFGGTYSAGVISGGTQFDLKSLNMSYGNVVKDLSLATTETVDIYNRSPKASVVIDLTATNDAAYIANMFAGTPTSFGLTHGAAAGFKVMAFAPVGRIIKKTDVPDGDLFLVQLDFNLQPSSAGNDELRLICL